MEDFILYHKLWYINYDANDARFGCENPKTRIYLLLWTERGSENSATRTEIAIDIVCTDPQRLACMRQTLMPRCGYQGAGIHCARDWE